MRTKPQVGTGTPSPLEAAFAASIEAARARTAQQRGQAGEKMRRLLADHAAGRVVAHVPGQRTCRVCHAAKEPRRFARGRGGTYLDVCAACHSRHAAELAEQRALAAERRRQKAADRSRRRATAFVRDPAVSEAIDRFNASQRARHPRPG